MKGKVYREEQYQKGDVYDGIRKYDGLWIWIWVHGFSV